MAHVPKALLDTDTVSFYLRGNPTVRANALAYMKAHGMLAFSQITRYEIARGLLAADATSQLTLFDQFCESCQVHPLEWSDLELASHLWSDLRAKGELISDADIFIAASALRRGMHVVTHNLSHFSRIPGLLVWDWTRPQPQG